MDTIKVILETQGSNSSFWTEFIRIIIPVISAFGGVIIGGVINNKMTLKTLKAKANEQEIQEIRDALNKFYQPILLLLQKNKQLKDMLSYGTSDGPRTLIELLKGKSFTGNDGKLLSKIIEIDNEINNIINTEKGRVKNKEISESLAKASVHFDIIKMAYEKTLIGEPERFEKYVFPKELQDQIVAEICLLTDILKGLENNE